MINVAKGIVEMRGSVMELLSEFTVIVESMREMLCKDFPPDVADIIIAVSGKIAFMSDEEREGLKNLGGEAK